MMTRNIWLWTLIIICLVVYVYATIKVSTNELWGYVCAIDFAILFILFVNVFVNDSNRRQVSENDKS